MASLTTRLTKALQKEFVEGTVYRIDLDRVDVAPDGSSGIMRSLPLTGDRDKIKPGDPVKIITVGGQRVALVGDVAFSDGEDEGAQSSDASEIEFMESLQGYAKGEITMQGATDTGATTPTTTSFIDTQTRDSFTTTAGQTTFTLSSTPASGTVLVYWNGILQRYTTDYTVSGATVTTVFSPGAGDIVDAVYSSPTNILANADMAVDDLSSQVPSQTFNTTYKFIGKSVAVYINGILQEPSIITPGANLQSFTVSSARNIVAGDKVLAVYPKGTGFSVADADTLDGKHASNFYLTTDTVAWANDAHHSEYSEITENANKLGGYSPATSGVNAHIPVTDAYGNLTISGDILGSNATYGILSLTGGSANNNTTTPLYGVWTGIANNAVALFSNGFQIQRAGIYVISLHIYWAQNANGSRECSLFKAANSWTDGTCLGFETKGAGPNGWVSHCNTVIASLAVNDCVHANVWQNSGGALGFDLRAGLSNSLTIARIA